MKRFLLALAFALATFGAQAQTVTGPQACTYPQVVTGFNSSGTVICATVDFSSLSFSGLLFATNLSDTTVEATSGITQTLALNDSTGFALNYTIQARNLNDPQCYFYGAIGAVDTGNQTITVATTVGVGGCTDNAWSVQVIAGPTVGVQASNTLGLSLDSFAIPAVNDIVSVTTGAALYFKPGSNIIFTALSDPTQSFVATSRAYNSTTGALTVVVIDVATGATGTFASWGLAQASPPGSASRSGLFVSDAGSGTFTVSPGQTIDDTGVMPIIVPTTITKTIWDLWTAGSGSTVGALAKETGTLSVTNGSTAITGSGTTWSITFGGATHVAGRYLVVSSAFRAAPNNKQLMATYTNNTSAGLSAVWGGSTGSGLDYSAITNQAASDYAPELDIYLIRKDTDGEPDIIAIAGGSVPTGYTYTAKIAVMTIGSSGGIGSIVPFLNIFTFAGANSVGLVPNPGPTTGTKFLRDDATWQTPSSGLTLLTSGTISAAATVDIVLTSYTAYRKIVIELINLIPASDNQEFNMRVSTNGGSSYQTTGYINAGMGASDADAPALNSSSITDRLTIGRALTTANNVGSTASEGISVTVNIAGQANTAIKPRITWEGIYFSANNHPVSIWGGGLQNTAQDTDAVSFGFGTAFGTNTTSGTYAVYGLN